MIVSAPEPLLVGFGPPSESFRSRSSKTPSRSPFCDAFFLFFCFPFWSSTIRAVGVGAEVTVLPDREWQSDVRSEMAKCCKCCDKWPNAWSKPKNEHREQQQTQRQRQPEFEFRCRAAGSGCIDDSINRSARSLITLSRGGLVRRDGALARTLTQGAAVNASGVGFDCVRTLNVFKTTTKSIKVLRGRRRSWTGGLVLCSGVGGSGTRQPSAGLESPSSE